jgi:hypothetical protein
MSSSNAYFVVEQDRTKGPLDVSVLETMRQQETVFEETLVWTNGITDWQPAKMIVPEIFSRATDTGAATGTARKTIESIVISTTLNGIAFCLVLAGCNKNEPVDEAKAAGLTTADFPQITADVFRPMDGGIDLSPEEIMGRNTWNLWSAGNQHFWNGVAQDSFGMMDLLKMLDNRKFPRGERFKTLGLVNEPGFRTVTKPDEFGLWLDEQEAEPEGIDETVYGKPSGVLGFRLFPNPDFNEQARKKWDGDRSPGWSNASRSAYAETDKP